MTRPARSELETAAWEAAHSSKGLLDLRAGLSRDSTAEKGDSLPKSALRVRI